VAKWRAYIGLPKEDVSVELALIVDYVKNNWGNLTLNEFELAWQLSINSKLDDVEYYGNFSPMYVSKVMQSYINYRKSILLDAIKRKEAYDYEQSLKPPSPEEQAENMKDILRSIHNRFLEEKVVFDPFNILYNFFRKNKWMKVSQSDIDIAMKEATTRYTNNQSNRGLFGLDKTQKKEENIKSLARNYLVEKYLEKNDINVLINNINSSLFSTLE
jgi:hypothetical protein